MEEHAVRMFHDAYINGNQLELDRLWKEVSPKKLIKFFPAQYLQDGTNYAIDCIVNQKLWMSSPKQFNDPFDCLINVDHEREALTKSRKILETFVGPDEANIILDSPLGKQTLQTVSDMYCSRMSAVDRYNEENMYVSCFSEQEQVRSLCMWAHYANNHKGICVEYDFTDVNNACSFGCIPILYTNKYSLQQDYWTNPVRRFLDFAYTKAKEWESEKEWRLSILKENTKLTGFSIAFVQPKNIYLGCKASEKLKTDLCLFCEENNIPLYQMRLQPGTYTIFEDRIL